MGVLSFGGFCFLLGASEYSCLIDTTIAGENLILICLVCSLIVLHQDPKILATYIACFM